MTIPEILKEMELCTGRFPMEAMRAAIEQREAITPELLRVLETVAENPTEFAPKMDYMLHLFALYLLAQFREQRAYAPIVKLFHAPGETTYKLVGDTVSEGLARIIGSVYNGDPTPLQRLVENQDADEFARSAALDAFQVLERTGQMPRDVVVNYYRSLFHGKLERMTSFVWDGLVAAAGDLPAPELLEEVRQAYRENLADPSVADFEDIERDMAAPNSRRPELQKLITDAIAEMEWWPAFRPKDYQAEKQPEVETPIPTLPSPPPPPTSYEAPKPYIRGPKIGPNDPCPCGSGKKYKKCCGKG
jgi:hypothetical protein